MTATFESCLPGRLMIRQLTDKNFEWREFVKMMPSLFAAREVLHFNLDNYIVFT